MHPLDTPEKHPTHQEIEERAYQLWEEEGRPFNRADEFWKRAKEQLSSPLPLLSLGDIFIKDSQHSLWMVLNPACDLAFSPRSKGRQPDRNQPIYLIGGALVDLRENPNAGNNEVTELFVFEERAYRILWDYRYVRSISLHEFIAQLTGKGYRRRARLALPYALRIQRAWTAHLDRIGLPSPPPMFEEADIVVYGQKSENEWLQMAEPVQGGAILVSRKISGSYEQLCVLTIPGEQAVYEGLGRAINLQSDRLDELEKEAAQVTESEKKHLPAKIQRVKAIREKMLAAQQDVTWRLKTLENPKAISSKGPAWAIDRLVAIYFEAGAQRAFDKQAQLVIDVIGPQTHAAIIKQDDLSS
jgi:hypothetical protein